MAFYRQKEGLGAFKVYPVRIEPKPEGGVPDTTILGTRVGIFHPALSPSFRAFPEHGLLGFGLASNLSTPYARWRGQQ